MGGSGSSSGKGGGGAGGVSAMRTRAEIESEVNSIKYRTSRGVSSAEYDNGNTYVESSNTSQAQRNPSSAPIGTKLSMGGYTYTKTKNNTWVTYGPTRKRSQNRKDADIKRVFM